MQSRQDDNFQNKQELDDKTVKYYVHTPGVKYDINTGEPSESPQAVIYKKAYVNRVTGQPTSKSKDPSAIKGDGFLRSIKRVDPITGQLSEAKNSIKYTTWRNRILVNSNTGKPTTKDDPKAKFRGTYHNDKLVNMETGLPPDDIDEQTISFQKYREIKRKAREQQMETKKPRTRKRKATSDSSSAGIPPAKKVKRVKSKLNDAEEPSSSLSINYTDFVSTTNVQTVEANEEQNVSTLNQSGLFEPRSILSGSYGLFPLLPSSNQLVDNNTIMHESGEEIATVTNDLPTEQNNTQSLSSMECVTAGTEVSLVQTLFSYFDDQDLEGEEGQSYISDFNQTTSILNDEDLNNFSCNIEESNRFSRDTSAKTSRYFFFSNMNEKDAETNTDLNDIELSYS